MSNNCPTCELLTASNAALREALELAEEYVPQYEGCVAWEALKALDTQPHPGAPMLEELTALRKVAEAARALTGYEWGNPSLGNFAGEVDAKDVWPILDALKTLHALTTQEAPNA